MLQQQFLSAMYTPAHPVQYAVEYRQSGGVYANVSSEPDEQPIYAQISPLPVATPKRQRQSRISARSNSSPSHRPPNMPHPQVNLDEQRIMPASDSSSLEHRGVQSADQLPKRGHVRVMPVEVGEDTRRVHAHSQIVHLQELMACVEPPPLSGSPQAGHDLYSSQMATSATKLNGSGCGNASSVRHRAQHLHPGVPAHAPPGPSGGGVHGDGVYRSSVESGATVPNRHAALRGQRANGVSGVNVNVSRAAYSSFRPSSADVTSTPLRGVTLDLCARGSELSPAGGAGKDALRAGILELSCTEQPWGVNDADGRGVGHYGMDKPVLSASGRTPIPDSFAKANGSVASLIADVGYNARALHSSVTRQSQINSLPSTQVGTTLGRGANADVLKPGANAAVVVRKVKNGAKRPKGKAAPTVRKNARKRNTPAKPKSRKATKSNGTAAKPIEATNVRGDPLPLDTDVNSSGATEPGECDTLASVPPSRQVSPSLPPAPQRFIPQSGLSPRPPSSPLISREVPAGCSQLPTRGGAIQACQSGAVDAHPLKNQRAKKRRRASALKPDMENTQKNAVATDCADLTRHQIRADVLSDKMSLALTEGSDVAQPGTQEDGIKLNADVPSHEAYATAKKRRVDPSCLGAASKCSLCCRSGFATTYHLHPLFSVRGVQLCAACSAIVKERAIASGASIPTAKVDGTSSEMSETQASTLAALAENMVLALAPSERISAGVETAYCAIVRQGKEALVKRFQALSVPFDMLNVLRVALNALGVSFQEGKLVWPVDPVPAPSRDDAVSMVELAFPPTLSDLLSETSAGIRAWNSTFSATPWVGSELNAREIFDRLLSLVGVKLRPACHSSLRKKGKEACDVNNGFSIDANTVCKAMRMAGGKAVDCLEQVFQAVERSAEEFGPNLEHAQGVEVNGRCLFGPLRDDMCCLCGCLRDGEKFPFRFIDCESCNLQICSLCMVRVCGQTEYSNAVKDNFFRCTVCRLGDLSSAVAQGKPGPLQHARIREQLKNKVRPGAESKKSKKQNRPLVSSAPFMPLLVVSSTLVTKLLGVSGGRAMVEESEVGFAKFCELGNERILTSQTATIDCPPSAADHICLACKMPVGVAKGARGGKGWERTDDLNESFSADSFYCASEGCHRVMHRDCLPQSKRGKRVRGKSTWSCPHHHCSVCELRDDTKLVRCRTCPVAFCNEHLPSTADVYVFSERLIACPECKPKLEPPSLCAVPTPSPPRKLLSVSSRPVGLSSRARFSGTSLGNSLKDAESRREADLREMALLSSFSGVSGCIASLRRRRETKTLR